MNVFKTQDKVRIRKLPRNGVSEEEKRGGRAVISILFLSSMEKVSEKEGCTWNIDRKYEEARLNERERILRWKLQDMEHTGFSVKCFTVASLQE